MEQHKILIVDDEPRNLRILQKALSKHYTLIEAANGEEALKKLEETEPAVILLDIMMPGIDGYETCKRIRNMEPHQNAKILLLSGKALLEEKLEGYAAGADDYLTKPFIREELEAKIKVFLKMYTLESELKRINSSLTKEVAERTEELLQSEQLAAVGRMSAEIVHNIRNPLTVIDYWANELAAEDPNNSSYDAMVKASTKMATIIAGILDVSRRKDDLKLDKVDIGAVVDEELGFLKIGHWATKGFEVEVKLDNLPVVNAVTNHISQVFMNLFRNAAEAMLGSEERKIKISAEIGKDMLHILVADSGPGISPDDLPVIFDAFFTTKKGDGTEDNPKGTGLGLASCREMIRSYKGDITVESTLGKGTTFKVSLPAVTLAEVDAA